MQYVSLIPLVGIPEIDDLSVGYRVLGVELVVRSVLRQFYLARSRSLLVIKERKVRVRDLRG